MWRDHFLQAGAFTAQVAIRGVPSCHDCDRQWFRPVSR
jgi:hypothetical protein